MREKRARRPKLRLVYSRPPARVMAAAFDLGTHLHAFDPRRGAKDPRYRDRFEQRTAVLLARLRGGEFRDMDDYLALIGFLWADVVGPLANRDGGPEITLARDLLRKALAAAGWTRSDGPFDRPPGARLAG